jgi:hypothetical protein
MRGRSDIATFWTSALELPPRLGQFNISPIPIPTIPFLNSHPAFLWLLHSSDLSRHSRHATLGSTDSQRHSCRKASLSLPLWVIGSSPFANCLNVTYCKSSLANCVLCEASGGFDSHNQIDLLSVVLADRLSRQSAVTMSTTCPFRISRSASDKLARNDAFSAVRENLRRQELGSEAPRFVPPPSLSTRSWTCH